MLESVRHYKVKTLLSPPKKSLFKMTLGFFLINLPNLLFTALLLAAVVVVYSLDRGISPDLSFLHLLVLNSI